MRSINTIDICYVSGGMIGAPAGSPLLSVGQTGPGGDLADTMAGRSTFTYDDGSTITTNGRSEVLGYTETPVSSVSIDWANCLQFAGSAAATALSSGWLAFAAGVSTAGSAIGCYNGSSVNY